MHSVVSVAEHLMGIAMLTAMPKAPKGPMADSLAEPPSCTLPV